MKRIFLALVAALSIAALASACMPDELTQEELNQFAAAKGGESCIDDQHCRGMGHLVCFKPVCDNGQCKKTVNEPSAPGAPCVVPDCETDCICAESKDVPNTEQIGHCIHK
jgi:hypothetical protein